MAASSEAGYMMSDGLSRTAATPRRNVGGLSSSSARPRGPPSENPGAPSEDGEGLEDDQVPRSSRIPDPTTIPRVEDRIGSLVQEHFESFIDG